VRVHERRRGLALVLVLTVVLALTIIATPFVLSMILQERSGTMSRYASQADWGADGARNFALWRLMGGVEAVERRAAAGLNATYYYDWPAEFDIRVDDATLTTKLKVADPKGAIWGLSTADEQGRLNVRTAPEQAIDRVKRAVDDRIVSHKDFLTLYSGRDAVWIVPQRIRSMGTAQPGMNTGPGLWCDSFHVLAPGSRVRVSKPGLPPFYARVQSNQMASGAPGLSLEPALPQAYMEGVIEVEQRHPVNLNTARREVLVAIFDGLEIIGQPSSRIDTATALRLANGFYGKPLKRMEEFLRDLGQMGLNPQQYEAVALNAVCPSWATLARTGTVPFCFKSYDAYTVEGYATMSNPAGASVATRGFREVVSVSPPNALSATCESQLDFDSMLRALAIVRPNLRLLGHPFGNRVQSYPRILPGPFLTETSTSPTGEADVGLKRQQQGPSEAYVMARPARDVRGEMAVQYRDALKGGWPMQILPQEHFDNDHEGRKLSGAPYALDWTRAFTTMPPNNPVRPDVAPGGIEFWAKFDGAGAGTTLFDIRENTTTNRLTLRIDGTDLVLTACDSTIPAALPQLLDDGTAEIRQPFVPESNTWYHFGAYWQGTRYAQLALLVDGFAHPQQKFAHYASDGTKIITKLNAGLSPTSTSLVLADESFLPPNTLTPLLIGPEVVLYDKSASTVVRGARGTTAINHPTGATVSVFGYTTWLTDGRVTADFGNTGSRTLSFPRLPVGGGTLRYNFGADPQAIVIGDKMNPPNPIRFVDAAQTDIPVMSPSITDFPDQGYIRIDGEVIFYTGRAAGAVAGAPGSNARFTGCVRGQHTTTAATHNTDRPVRMWAVATTDTTNYEDHTIIQVGDEWFGPVQKDQLRPGYWISYVFSGSPVNLRRGLACFGTAPSAHSAADPVIPTFTVQAPAPMENLGRGDVVTIMDAQNNKECHTVNLVSPLHAGMNAYWPENGWNWAAPLQIAAFRQNVAREYRPGSLHDRIVKFPSGELLGLNWLTTAGNQQVSIGPFPGMIDEVRAFAAERTGQLLNAEMTAGDAQLTLFQPDVTLQYGGLLKVGDEYIGYGDCLNGQATQLRRGWLGSAPEVPGRGVGMPYDKGYVLIDDLAGGDEIVLFEWNNGDGLTLGMPPSFSGNGGLYRGMFGTQAGSHDPATALVYGIPWRYWDTYKPREFDNTMSYYQWSTKLEGATWRSVQWVEEIPSGDKNIAVHALVRLDGKAEFWEAPGQTGSAGAHLFEFTGGGGKKTINRSGYQLDAGQFDIRFYWEYRPGAFDVNAPWASNSWKRAPKIKEIRVDYERPTQTLHHEDR
jgi:hypothetical protein